MNKRRFFFDADGVLFQFDKTKTFEEVCAPGYFKTVTPVPVMLEVFRMLELMGEDVYILTKAFDDGHSREDKLFSFRQNLPGISNDRILFVSYSESKSDAVRALSKQDILIDDFTPNCKEWGGTAVKLYNGYNGTNGTWRGCSVNLNSDAPSIIGQLLGISMAVERGLL